MWKASGVPGSIAPMSTMQLLRHVGEEGAADLELVANPHEEQPRTFERAGRLLLPRFGNDDLLLLAAALGELGYSTTWLDLRDQRFNPLDDDYDDELLNELLPRMRRKDATAALTYLRSYARGIVVNAVQLADPDGDRLRIDRDGTVTLNHQRSGLGHDLAAGWRRVIAE
jgi:hypothetical protein